LSRAFRLSDRSEFETIIEVFNLTSRRNNLSRNANFGTGSYPENPSPSFNQITSVGEPRGVQLGLRLKF
ncbi:MAG: hypothetical protein ABI972_20010, partial [Acidobacteriota bacterium]